MYRFVEKPSIRAGSYYSAKLLFGKKPREIGPPAGPLGARTLAP
jgi:hypothetical protein